jgi:hypothetical protein
VVEGRKGKPRKAGEPSRRRFELNINSRIVEEKGEEKTKATIRGRQRVLPTRKLGLMGPWDDGTTDVLSRLQGTYLI